MENALQKLNRVSRVEERSSGEKWFFHVRRQARGKRSMSRVTMVTFFAQTG
jgi:hypothetical protein